MQLLQGPPSSSAESIFGEASNFQALPAATFSMSASQWSRTSARLSISCHERTKTLVSHLQRSSALEKYDPAGLEREVPSSEPALLRRSSRAVEFSPIAKAGGGGATAMRNAFAKASGSARFQPERNEHSYPAVHKAP
jgi:hypothetical protein